VFFKLLMPDPHSGNEGADPSKGIVRQVPTKGIVQPDPTKGICSQDPTEGILVPDPTKGMTCLKHETYLTLCSYKRKILLDFTRRISL
jgi:hypothetical protein